jgi:hypothetical protein
LSTPIPFHSTPDSFAFGGEEVLGFVSGMFGVRDLRKMVSIISGEKKKREKRLSRPGTGETRKSKATQKQGGLQRREDGKNKTNR